MLAPERSRLQSRYSAPPSEVSTHTRRVPRPHPPRQPEASVTYIHLIARGTIDEKVLKALRDKADLAKALVDDYRAGRNPFTA